jgi:hypothetical protein
MSNRFVSLLCWLLLAAITDNRGRTTGRKEESWSVGLLIGLSALTMLSSDKK